MNAARAVLSAVGGHGLDVERVRGVPPARAVFRRCTRFLRLGLGLGLLLGAGSPALAEPEPPRPEQPVHPTPAVPTPAAAAAAAVVVSPKPKSQPAATPASPSGKAATAPKKPRLLIELPPPSLPPPQKDAAEGQPAGGPVRSSAGPTSVRKEVRLPLAPTAAELAKPDKLAPPRPTTMQEAARNPAQPQDRRFPTAVTNSAGPQGPAGAQTSGDRKGMLIENTGPQTGTIRNRWVSANTAKFAAPTPFVPTGSSAMAFSPLNTGRIFYNGYSTLGSASTPGAHPIRSNLE